MMRLYLHCKDGEDREGRGGEEGWDEDRMRMKDKRP